MQGLRALGYRVEAHPRSGYRLVASPDLLLPTEVQPRMGTARFGRSMAHHLQVGSTMDLAWAAAAEGAPEGHLVVAEEQTAGRGRLQRFYFCPPGGLWFSLVLRPSIAPALAPPLALVAAVGVAEGIREATGLVPEVKWPNDLLLQGRKVVGMLLEMSAEADLVHFLVLGVGVNASIPRRSFPAELRQTAISLSEALGRPVPRADLLATILKHLERRYDELLSRGLGPALEAWRRMPNMLGQRVTVKLPTGGELQGVAEALDGQGALVVRDDAHRRHRILVGDVLLQGTAPSARGKGHAGPAR